MKIDYVPPMHDTFRISIQRNTTSEWVSFTPLFVESHIYSPKTASNKKVRRHQTQTQGTKCLPQTPSNGLNPHQLPDQLLQQLLLRRRVPQLKITRSRQVDPFGPQVVVAQ